MRTLYSIALIFFICMSASAKADDCKPGTLDLRDQDSVLRFQVEVMDTEETRSRGLMFRETMPKFSGMLFVYEQPGPVAFWMRNTLIPLDMLFFDRTGQLRHIHRNAVPLDETPIPGGEDIQFVLEINGGLSQILDIDEAAEIRHPAIDSDMAAWSCND